MPEKIVRDLGLDLRLIRRTVSSYTPDPRRGGTAGLLVDGSDPAATAASFAQVAGSARELEAWESFYAMTAQLARTVFPTLTEPLRSRAQVREMVGDEAWERIFERPLAATLDELFADDVVRGIVASDGLIGTFSRLDAPDLRQNRCLLYHVIGRETGDWLLPEHGMGAVTAQIERAARDAGAAFHTDCRLTAIDLSDDAVHLTLDGASGEREVVARDLVVGFAPAELARLLGEEEPAPEGAQLKVNLLLSRLPRLRDGADPRVAFSGTAHFNESATQLDAAYETAAGGRIPGLVPCETYCHSLADPSILGAELRAAGVQTLTVFALQLPARLFAADNDRARDEALASVLASLNGLLDEPVEELAMRGPSGERCIEAVTPWDLQEQLAMPAGHIFHRDLAWPFAQSDAHVGAWGVETAHPHVFIGGAGAQRGGGVSGIPGHNAAMAVLERRGNGAARPA
jgi:phytoene dehydrogenase-like protein